MFKAYDRTQTVSSATAPPSSANEAEKKKPFAGNSHRKKTRRHAGAQRRPRCVQGIITPSEFLPLVRALGVQITATEATVPPTAAHMISQQRHIRSFSPTTPRRWQAAALFGRYDTSPAESISYHEFVDTLLAQQGERRAAPPFL